MAELSANTRAPVAKPSGNAPGPLAHFVRNIGDLRRRLGLALEIEVDGRRLHFSRPQDFEFALAGRTALPRQRAAVLAEAATPALIGEATALRSIEQRLVEALDASLQGRRSLQDSLGELGGGLFAREAAWRSVFRALALSGRELELFRRVAVAKYLQFLGAQQQFIALILRHQGEQAGALPGLEDTLGIDGDPASGLEAADGHALVRLPRGEPREATLPRGEGVNLRLADRGFTLIAGQPLTLVDEGGRVHPLGPGTHGIGRDLRNAIVLDTAYRTLSRRHLVVEVLGAERLRLTDLSSHGTWLEQRCLER